MLNSSSRRALYTGITNALTTRVLEHQRAENLKSCTDQYRAFRLVYYEAFADVRAVIAREKQIKGWTWAKKNALVASMNPQWRDLVLEWEKKYGLVFQVDGRIVKAETGKATPTPATATARSFAQRQGSGLHALANSAV
jgi:putative endonuclease